MVQAKRIVAFVLIICFFLPLSQCSTTKSNTEEIKRSNASEKLTLTDVNSIYYPYKTLELDSLKSLVTIAVFFFWLPFLLVEGRLKKIWKKAAFGVSELAACGFSIYGITLVNFIFYKPLFFGYNALMSVLIYFIISFMQVVEYIRGLVSDKKI